MIKKIKTDILNGIKLDCEIVDNPKNVNGGFVSVCTKVLKINYHALKLNYDEYIKKIINKINEELKVVINNAYLKRHSAVNKLVVSDIYVNCVSGILDDDNFNIDNIYAISAGCLVMVNKDYDKFIYGTVKGYGEFKPFNYEFED